MPRTELQACRFPVVGTSSMSLSVFLYVFMFVLMPDMICAASESSSLMAPGARRRACFPGACFASPMRLAILSHVHAAFILHIVQANTQNVVYFIYWFVRS